MTKSEVFKTPGGQLRIHRVSIALPLARWLLGEYGEFLLIDCTFKLTIYVGRYHIVISVIDRYGHVHPVVISEVPGHRTEDWLSAFNDGHRMVQKQTPTKLHRLLDKQPRRAFLMRDGEGAITTAWDQSVWPSTCDTGQCLTHGRWTVQKAAMANGEQFGPVRGQAWYGLLFKTCAQSYADSAGEIIAVWEERGDHVGAQHLRKLMKESKAPLHRWPEFACPGITAQGSESINQVIKKSPKDGTRRFKQTWNQFSKTVISVGYRSYQLLLEGPRVDKGRRAKRMKKLQRERGAMSNGKYAVLLASLEQLTFRAFKMVEKMVAESERHHVEHGDEQDVVHGTQQVWANYQALSHPDHKYVHLIRQINDKWVCTVQADGKACWQNKVRGILCSHIAAYAVKTINAGGKVDFRCIANTCLPRHRATQVEVVGRRPPTLYEPNYDRLYTLPQLSQEENNTIYSLMDTARTCARRAGPSILDMLGEFLQLRLLGVGPGSKKVYELADKIMTCVRAEDHGPLIRKDKGDTSKPIYVNNEVDPGNKQRQRMRNRGDVAALSVGFKAQQRLAVKKKQQNVVLSGTNERLDTKYATVEKVQAYGFICTPHNIYYMTPFTASQVHEQRKILQEAGLFEANLVGIDLEWGGPRYPTRKVRAKIYDASLLVLSCRTATVLIHLYQYQDVQSKCMQWPGPYLTKVHNKRTGRWNKAKPTEHFHGHKWTMPEGLQEYFLSGRDEKRTYAGRAVKGDFTRLRNVFGDIDCLQNLSCFDINKLRGTDKYASATRDDSLSAWMERVTGLRLPDKGSSMRTKGWNSLERLPKNQIMYAAMDGIASFTTAREYLCLVVFGPRAGEDARCVKCDVVLRSVLRTCESGEYFRCRNCRVPLTVSADGQLVEYHDEDLVSSDDDAQKSRKPKPLRPHTTAKLCQKDLDPVLKMGVFKVRKKLSKADVKKAEAIIRQLKGDRKTAYLWYCIRITLGDLYTLNDTVWLNDNIIDCYLQMIRAALDDLHVFSTHFWNRMQDRYQYEHVQNYTKHLDKKLFRYRVALFPIHWPGHWTLGVIQFAQQKIHYLDSCGGKGDEYTAKLLQYLRDEWEHAYGHPMPEEEAAKWTCQKWGGSCPQQKNGCDCGVFVCSFALCMAYDVRIGTFTQQHMLFFRYHIALSLAAGRIQTFLTYPEQPDTEQPDAEQPESGDDNGGDIDISNSPEQQEPGDDNGGDIDIGNSPEQQEPGDDNGEVIEISNSQIPGVTLRLSHAEVHNYEPSDRILRYNARCASTLANGEPIDKLVKVVEPTAQRAIAAAVVAKLLNHPSFTEKGVALDWVRGGSGRRGSTGNRLRIDKEACAGYSDYPHVEGKDGSGNEQMSNTLRLTRAMWVKMKAKRDALRKKYTRGWNLLQLAETRLGEAFIIAYTFLLEEMQQEVVKLRGSCGELVDTHTPNSANPYANFVWHTDNHAELDTPPGLYIEHSVTCQLSVGRTSMAVAGKGELLYEGPGSFVVFPAWSIHRTKEVEPDCQCKTTKTRCKCTMWKMAGFFETGATAAPTVTAPITTPQHCGTSVSKDRRRRTHGWNDSQTPPPAANTRNRRKRKLQSEQEENMKKAKSLASTITHAHDTRFRKRNLQVQKGSAADPFFPQTPKGPDIRTRSQTATPFTTLPDIVKALHEQKRPGGMLNFALTDYDDNEYYKALKAPGGDRFLRKLQKTKLEVLVKMTHHKRLIACLMALSEYDFGFSRLQAVCRTIILPVGYDPHTYISHPYSHLCTRVPGQKNGREYAPHRSQDTQVLYPESEARENNDTTVQSNLFRKRHVGTEQRVGFGRFHDEKNRAGGDCLYLLRRHDNEEPCGSQQLCVPRKVVQQRDKETHEKVPRCQASVDCHRSFLERRL